MKGYAQNLGNAAYFVLQRQVPPGGKVKLEDAFKVVGKKSGLTEDQTSEFVQFLKETVLLRGTWGYFDDSGVSLDAPVVKGPKAKKVVNEKISTKKQDDAKGAGRNLRRADADDTGRGVEITPASIIEASYDDARTLIEKTKDRVVLKKALTLTKHFAGKEQHMRHILKKLEQTA
jgi:hypothetical protein